MKSWLGAYWARMPDQKASSAGLICGGCEKVNLASRIGKEVIHCKSYDAESSFNKLALLAGQDWPHSRYPRRYNHGMQNLLHNLNPEQLAAVTLPAQSALILAGAGSGK